MYSQRDGIPPHPACEQAAWCYLNLKLKGEQPPRPEERERVRMGHLGTRVRLFHLTLGVACLLLVLLYLSGMLVNLYVQFPSTLPGGNAWGWAFTKNVLTQIHIYLGSLLLVVALAALVLSIIVRRTPGIVAAIVGFAMILLAYLAGIWFLSFGQQSMSSLWMSLGFLGALLAYLLGYEVTRPVRSETQSK